MTKFLEVKKCNICKSKKREKRFSLKQQNLVKCFGCGLFYLDKQHVDEESLYDKDYYKASDNSTTALYSNYVMQEKVVKKKFKFAHSRIINKFSARSKLLEIGCGYGYFLELFSEKMITYAVEISNIAAKETIKNNPEAEVYNSDFLKVTIIINLILL